MALFAKRSAGLFNARDGPSSMNGNLERLKDLKERIEAIQRDCSGVLAREPAIAEPLHRAASAAQRKYKQVTESEDPSISGPYSGFVP